MTRNALQVATSAEKKTKHITGTGTYHPAYRKADTVFGESPVTSVYMDDTCISSLESWMNRADVLKVFKMKNL